MDTSGHSTIDFDKENEGEVSEAMRRFRLLTAHGYTAAATIAPGRHRLIHKFDPEADTVFVPQLQAG